MSVHQILTGALNRGDGVFSVGTVDGLNFTACAVGTNVVILSSAFERIQVITPANGAEGLLVKCVAACRETGKVVATYGDLVRIYEPSTRVEDGNNVFPYHWIETDNLILKNSVDKIQWNLQGLRLLLCCGDILYLYQHSVLSAALAVKLDKPVTFGIIEEENEGENEGASCWDYIWSQKLASKPKFMSCSPDGAYFATCGISDCLVRIWFQREKADGVGNGVSFGFNYLQHPEPVSGFEWRNVPRYMSRHCVQNALLTWCEDNTVRIWKESTIVSLDFQSLNNTAVITSIEKNLQREHHSKRHSLRGTRTRIKTLLKRFSDKKRLVSETQRPARSSFSRNALLFGIASGERTDSSPAFYLCTTINAHNDCLLVPSLETVETQKLFVIHWLNNKEIVYDVGVDRVMVEALGSDRSPESNDMETFAKRNSSTDPLYARKEINVEATDEPSTYGSNELGEMSDEVLMSNLKNVTKGLLSGSLTEIITSKDSVDLKLDMLIHEWRKSSDILFAVHPVDGSLLTWTIEWLDDAFRQPTVNFTSRFPSAFSLSDATSLNPLFCVYYPHHTLHAHFTQRSISSDELSRILEQRNSNLLHLLTHHHNGSLNMWNMTMEDNGKFNVIVNISHASRMCGHRYKISQVIAHPVLPLMLTTSHYNYITQDAEETGKAELILWKVKPVSPLCKCGGVRELTRITSNSSDSYTAVTWLPTILPSSSLGSLSASPSSCFVANSSGYLNIYQAVIDAAEFLAELRNCGGRDSLFSESGHCSGVGKTSGVLNGQKLSETYKVVSTQSSSKPGCILLMSRIGTVPSVDKVLLLHVFDESLLISQDNSSSEWNASHILESEKVQISRYYLVSFENERKTHTRLRMWLISIVSMDLENFGDNEELSVKDLSEPLSVGNKNEDCSTKVQFKTKLVYDDHVVLPDGISVVSVEPSAGHFSSSNLYPPCRALYLVLLACSDEHIRFYECSRTIGENGEIDCKWRMWGMVGSSADSSVEMDGQIYSVASAHSSRFACAYLPEGMAGTRSEMNCVKVGVFECESSGGVEWLREDTIIVNAKHSTSKETHFVGREESEVASCIGIPCSNVRLNWVCAEDGSHILTVAMDRFVFLYTQLSQGAAQRNIVMMKEHDTHRRAPLRKASSLANLDTVSTRLVRWLCIRFLELKSADGLPPLPTTLGWVRDGLLIIGMQSEMRCYSQWNFKAELLRKQGLEEAAKDLSKRRPPSQLALASLGISPSHSFLEQLSKKPKQETVPLNKQNLYKDLLHRVYSAPHDLQTLLSKDEHILEAISDEGLFEAARLANPILPQYHPKLLIELLNSGRTRVVKAILLHVLKSLKQLNVLMPNPLSRASSMRKMSLTDGDLKMEGFGQDSTRVHLDTFDDSNLEYDELDGIAPLPFHMLLSASVSSSVESEKASEVMQNRCSSLFDKPHDESNSYNAADIENDLTSSRHNSLSVDDTQMDFISANFTARHNRLLTEFLTHTHLPGLSSVDQMHLLAVADTLSHFSSDVMDKLTQANAAFQAAQPRVMSDAASGYATPTVGFETVDEFGLRYLMAMKQREYLLLCLPLQQKCTLRARGLSPSQIIWALHSETETELLNAIPCLQKPSLAWDELRALGVAWWLKNTSSLRMIVEKLAKAAFQRNQDPMDASLYYLIMKKKNLLAHLFKTVKDNKMLDFFMHDFNEEKWRKAAMKNAFVLMGKQRFEHAAAFFLLAGSMKDALQIILSRLQDLQLAMVTVRLYETDYEEQNNLLRELLCREILGTETTDLTDCNASSGAHRDPFVRSMAYWHLKEYVRAANTLLDEAGIIRLDNSMEYSLSDIFNFYSFIRTHPLVIRQRLANAKIQTGSTEKFLAVAKHFASVITPAERRLYFRTASAHLASGCPLLALDVLERLPKNLTVIESPVLPPMFNGYIESLSTKGGDIGDERANVVHGNVLISMRHNEGVDLRLNNSETESGTEERTLGQKGSIKEDFEHKTSLDIIAQHMKFIAALRLLVEELSTLASGFEIDGGQLRYQLLNWLEAGVNVLQRICDYRSDYSSLKLVGNVVEDKDKFSSNNLSENSLPRYKVNHMEKVEVPTRIQLESHRRRWLCANQKLLRAFTSYCTLHNSQNHRLTSALMELLLLLMEVQQDCGSSERYRESIPMVHSFPLFTAAVSPFKMFVSSPLSFMKSLCTDILLTLVDIAEPPLIESSLTKVYKLYSLCQGLSSCLYHSLCDVSAVCGSNQQAGALTKLSKGAFVNDDFNVTTSPSKWPGVENLSAILYKRKEEAPHLKVLILEIYTAVFVSLFAYALTAYDARWLFRLAARNIDFREFAVMFGGGGESNQEVVSVRLPGSPVKQRVEVSSDSFPSAAHANFDRNGVSIDSSSFRTRFSAKKTEADTSTFLSDGSLVNSSRSGEERVMRKWIPPKKSIVQFFAEKPDVSPEIIGMDYDSDDEKNESEVELEEELQKEQHNDSEGFAWRLLRLALTHQQLYRMKSFVKLAGLEYAELPALSPRANAVFKLVENWTKQLEEQLYAFHDGCPLDLLPDLSVKSVESSTALPLKKYSTILDVNNTPFECADPAALPVKRIWLYLVHQEHILPIFIKHIFGSGDQDKNVSKEGAIELGRRTADNVFKIVQREHEPVAAFCCNEVSPGWLAVSNTRELQEMDIRILLDHSENSKLSSWMYSRAEIDIVLDETKSTTLEENDDYQLLIDNGQQIISANFVYKRQVNGIRRLDSHPTMPYYVSGSSDGSIRLWEWGVGQPLFTPRIAGQFAKVTKVLFSCNGSKFASVDNDGVLCLWQATQGLPVKKPFFNQKCHSKSAADVRFLGAASSVLVTAGLSLSDENVALWDTLMPQTKALVHSWAAHPEGATSVLYLSGLQSIVSGGRHGELCVWDVRQRRLRTTVKCFENSSVKCLVNDPFQQFIVAGSSDGDIKVWNTDLTPQLVANFDGEHVARGGFSLRQVASTVQGVQQLHIDPEIRLFSCGADCSLKIRSLFSLI